MENEIKREKWEALVKKTSTMDVGEFELGVLAGISAGYTLGRAEKEPDKSKTEKETA